WAAKDLDDRAWGTALPALAPSALPAEGWSGAGWFRRHLRFDPDLGSSLTLRLETLGSSELWVDGTLLLVAEERSAEARRNPFRQGPPTGAWSTVAPAPGVEHVFAVRHRARPLGGGPAGDPVGFRVTVEPAGTADQVRDHRKGQVALQAIFTALPLFLAL